MSLFFYAPLITIILLHVSQVKDFLPGLITDQDDIITLVCCAVIFVHSLMSGMMTGGF